jgi:hypothetical protein
MRRDYRRERKVNRQQREQNRRNARFLADQACICPECGERGKHWIEANGFWNESFWICDKFYDADGFRIAGSAKNG